MAKEIGFLTVHETLDAFAAGRLGPVAVMENYLDRIERHEPKLQAFVEVYADEALSAAHAAQQAIESGHRVGPLHGIPVAVKDIVEIDGRVTTGGSAAWADRRSTYTATLVTKMIAAGMIVLGKTHTVEFAMGGWGTNQRLGTPWNPWDLKVHRTPGGSSAGTGVAVAAGLAPWGIGTDTGGSVRLPAGWCGLAGLKTTVGRISTHGVLPLASTLDTPGPLARSVADAALLLSVLQGADEHDLRTRGVTNCEPFAELGRGVGGLRLAVMPDSERTGVDTEVLERFDASLEVLRGLGATLETVEQLPRTFAEFTSLTGKIIFAEGYAVVGDLCERKDAPLDEDVRPRILAGRECTAREYLDTLAEKERTKQAFAEKLSGFDALLTPTIATPAVPVDSVDQSGSPAGFTRVVNFLDRCAMTVPNGLTKGGLPTGLQIICDPFAEPMALRIAAAYEAATDWHRQTPNGL